jgi:hypothetical protein
MDAATTLAALKADLRDAGLRDVVGWSSADSKGAVRAEAFAEGSGAADNKLIEVQRSLTLKVFEFK